MNNAFLGKTMEKLVREPNHYITKIISLAIDMRKTQIL